MLVAHEEAQGTFVKALCDGASSFNTRAGARHLRGNAQNIGEASELMGDGFGTAAFDGPLSDVTTLNGGLDVGEDLMSAVEVDESGDGA